MFKPAKMKKIRLMCLKAVAPLVIRALHNMSALHIKDTNLPEISRSSPLASYSDISQRHIRIRSIIDAFGDVKFEYNKKAKVINPVNFADKIIAKYDEYVVLCKEREEAEKSLDPLLLEKGSLSGIGNLKIDFSKLSHESLQFILLRTKGEKAAKVRQALAENKDMVFMATEAADGKSTYYLIAKPNGMDSKGIEEHGELIPMPAIQTSPSNRISEIEGQEKEIRTKIKGISDRISELISSNYYKFVIVEEALAVEAERASISTKFGESPALYYIEGWVEASRSKNMAEELSAQFGNKIHILEYEPNHHDTPPTLLENPNSLQPFQFLVDFLSPPQYKELDPTIFLTFFVPVIYALIFGDAGYAVLSFFLARWMVGKSKPGSLLYAVASIWMISAIPTFFVGVMFDEYFGFTHSHLLEILGMPHMQLYEGLHRVSSITTLILITILVGMLHLAVGFVIGAMNDWGHSKKHALAKLSWIGIEVGGFLVVANLMFDAYPEFFLPSLGLFALSTITIVIGEGVIALFEIPGLAANIMSYLRIAAVGVGGVILAEAVNELLLPRLDFSPIGILFFIIISILFVIGHLFACVLAMFEAFVHGTRLNIVEFFGKFFKGNGAKFMPFTSKRYYTKDL